MAGRQAHWGLICQQSITWINVLLVRRAAAKECFSTWIQHMSYGWGEISTHILGLFKISTHKSNNSFSGTPQQHNCSLEQSKHVFQGHPFILHYKIVSKINPLVSWIWVLLFIWQYILMSPEHINRTVAENNQDNRGYPYHFTIILKVRSVHATLGIADYFAKCFYGFKTICIWHYIDLWLPLVVQHVHQHPLEAFLICSSPGDCNSV